jgi:WD40 repeat protein
VVFSPDGTTLAIADGDGTARLWNVSTRAQIGAPIIPGGSNGGVNWVAFSPDGTTLATADHDGTVWLWDVSTHAQIGAPITLPGGSNGLVDGVAFNPNGKILATADGDGTARLWDVAFPTNLVKAVCSIASRPITQPEWRTYVPSEPFQQVCPTS